MCVFDFVGVGILGTEFPQKLYNFGHYYYH